MINKKFTSTSLKKKCVSAKLNIISSIPHASCFNKPGFFPCFVANWPVKREWNTTMVSSRSHMNIRSGPASVVSAEPILFPLPLCRLPRLHGFVDVPVSKNKIKNYILFLFITPKEWIIDWIENFKQSLFYLFFFNLNVKNNIHFTFDSYCWLSRC